MNLTKEIAELIERARLYRSCVTCQWFDMQREICTLNGVNARPPAIIIAKGCDSYFEEPPF